MGTRTPAGADGIARTHAPANAAAPTTNFRMDCPKVRRREIYRSRFPSSMAGSAAFFSSLEVTGSKRNVDGVESRDSSSKSEHTQAPLIVGAQAVLRAGITLEIGRF